MARRRQVSPFRHRCAGCFKFTARRACSNERSRGEKATRKREGTRLGVKGGGRWEGGKEKRREAGMKTACERVVYVRVCAGARVRARVRACVRACV
eukprot:5861999-Pleurochrysis_carterae.AAC.1